MKSSRRSKLPRVVAALLATTGLIVLGVLGLAYQQEIRDTFEGMAYTPSAAVASIEERIGITSDGERIFHATAPSVVGAEAFNEACPRQEVASPIVGCYKPQDSIYIYDVTNDDLDGIRDVTAAHELLHAVWRRMSPTEQDRIGSLLEDIYARKSDDALTERMAYYERTQKGQERNELHSILGTEERELNDELEAHYAQYFNRGAVVALFEGYQQHYSSLSERVAVLQKQLEELTISISAQNGAYSRDAAQLDADIKTFNSRAQGGAFTSQAQFTAERSQLESRVSVLEGRRATVNELIRKYNDLYREYKDTAEEIQALNNSIDSFKTLEESSSLQGL